MLRQVKSSVSVSEILLSRKVQSSSAKCHACHAKCKAVCVWPTSGTAGGWRWLKTCISNPGLFQCSPHTEKTVMQKLGVKIPSIFQYRMILLPFEGPLSVPKSKHPTVTTTSSTFSPASLTTFLSKSGPGLGNSLSHGSSSAAARLLLAIGLLALGCRRGRRSTACFQCRSQRCHRRRGGLGRRTLLSPCSVPQKWH